MTDAQKIYQGIQSAQTAELAHVRRDWEPIDSYHLLAGKQLRPEWRDAEYRRWFAWRPVKTADSGWKWLKTVRRRVRHAHRATFTPFGVYYRRKVDYLASWPAA